MELSFYTFFWVSSSWYGSQEGPSLESLYCILLKDWEDKDLSYCRRNICMKANTTDLTDKFQILTHTNGFLYGLAMTYCYVMAVKTG